MNKRTQWRVNDWSVVKIFFVCVLVNLLVMLPSSTGIHKVGVAQARINASCQLTWKPVTVPARLWNEIAVVSQNDVWGIGNAIMHWDGSMWSITQDLYVNNESLLDIAVMSANDIWAVGWANTDSVDHSLVMHWNGTNWSKVLTPDIGPIYGIAALSPNSIWIIGNRDDSEPVPTALHWNGNDWQMVPMPFSDNRARYGRVSAISAISENDIWAVGGFIGHSSALSDVLVWHWDGVTWTYMPMELDLFATFSAVSAISSNDVWAVGSVLYDRVLIAHWDGTQWRTVAGDYAGILTDVQGRISDDAWAVGWYETGDSRQMLIEHWDGTKWNVVKLPYQEGNQNALGGISVVSESEVWAIGSAVMHGILPCLSTKPTKPELVSPSKHTNIANNQVKLRWKSASSANWYEVIVKKGDKIVDKQMNLTNVRYITKPLKRNNWYTWRVRACNSVGCRSSAWWQFFVPK